MAQSLMRTTPRGKAPLGLTLLRRSGLHSAAVQAKSLVVSWGYWPQHFTEHKSFDLTLNGTKYAQRLGRKILAAGSTHYMVGFSEKACSLIATSGMNNCGQLKDMHRRNEKTKSIIGYYNVELLGMACGREHSMIIMTDDGIPDQYKRLPSSMSSPPPPPALASSSSSTRTKLVAFGNSMYGQLGSGASQSTLSAEFSGKMSSGSVFEATPIKVMLPDPSEYVVQVQCGLEHTIVLTDQGNLYAMGYGGEGQLGLGPESTLDRAVPTLIERQSWKTRGKEVGRVKQISSSTDFTLALTESNQLWIWGSAEHGQCMINKKMYRILEPMHIPHPILQTETIASVAAGGTFGLLLTESGKVYTCGTGALGLGREKTQVLMPEHITTLSGIRKIAASAHHAAAIDDKGHLYTWGLCGNTRRLGHEELEDHYEPKRVAIKEWKGLNGEVADVTLGEIGGLARIEYE